MTKINMQQAQTCFDLFLTHIKQVKLLQDVHTLLTESLNTFKINKIKSERSRNDYNLHAANTKVLELVSYTRINGETLIGWSQTAERLTYKVQK